MKKKRERMSDEHGSRSTSSFSVPHSSLALHPSSLIPHPFIRLFCAIELPAKVRARAADHIARLREIVPEVRASWERTEKLHITLKFLGEIAAERVEALSGAASSATLSIHPFTLALSGAGAFPPRGNPRILWLGIDDSSGALTRLQSRLEEECASAGFAREERSFHPHLTIARIRAPQGARTLAQIHQGTIFEAIEFAVTSLVVMQSELGTGGSRYTEISRHAFSDI
jgi:RNA 2',3'-cyclic 3'-phosphodiesterase